MNSVAASGGLTGVARHGEAWRRAIVAMAAYVIILLGLYRDVALGMTGIWYRSETFTHCFLIPVIAVWLIWRQRQALAGMLPAPSPTAFVAVAVAGFAWLLGALGAVNALEHFALVGLLVLGVPTIFGYRITSAIAFPLAFLFFAVPFGEFVMPQMMEWTASFTILALRASGVPVFRDGLQFVIPSGTWSVVEACSGVRYLIASFTVGTLFAYLNYRSATRRLMFMLVSLLVPVIANWLRAYLIVMLGHLSGNRLAVGVDHLIYGWVFFGVVIMIMFAIGARWSDVEITPSPPASSPPADTSGRRGFILPPLAVAVILVAIVTVPLLAEARIVALEGVFPVKLAKPAAPAGWRMTLERPSSLRPSFEGPADELHVSFARGEENVGLYVGYFRNQGPGRKLISSASVLVASDNSHWAQSAVGSREVPFGDAAVGVVVSELRGGALQAAAVERRWLAWQVYWVDGQWTASPAVAKILTVRSRLLGRRDDSAVVVAYTDKGGPDAAGTLAAFTASAMPSVQAALVLTRAAQ